MHRLVRRGVLLVALVGVVGVPAAGAQSAGARAVKAARPVAPQPVPFWIGERLDYDLRFGSLKVGSGSMEVRDVVDIRGVMSWHTVFTISGGIPLYRVNDTFESWFDVTTLTSRRFHQNIAEGNYVRQRRYEIYPERGVFTANGDPERPTVAQPLDDGSFLYFVRTLPLDVGAVFTVPRYFNPEGNPVRITVLRRDTIEVPAGRFPTVVLQPTFRTKGIFSENGRAEIWITDDDRRMMVQMKSRLSFGSLNLHLRHYSPRPPR